MLWRYQSHAHPLETEALSAWQPADTPTLAQCCQEAGIRWGHWAELPTKTVSEGFWQQPTGVLQAEALTWVKQPLTHLKQRFGYLTEDLVALHPTTPDLTAKLAPFEREHHHADDEVRVILLGEGVFGICPPETRAFALKLEVGDWIVIPAHTRHWFTLTHVQTVVALRVFKEAPQWEAIY
jgi:cupin superfamily acireductone dioxygenase involved in methionine salvage